MSDHGRRPHGCSKANQKLPCHSDGISFPISLPLVYGVCLVSIREQIQKGKGGIGTWEGKKSTVGGRRRRIIENGEGETLRVVREPGLAGYGIERNTRSSSGDDMGVGGYIDGSQRYD